MMACEQNLRHIKRHRLIESRLDCVPRFPGLVDGATMARLRSRGISPDQLLDRHDSYHALEAAGALYRTGTTGTNVMDLTIVLVGQPADVAAAP